MSATAIGDEQGRVLSTLNEDGSRRWLKPKPSPGRFLFRRRVVGYALIAFFVSLPHFRINGKPPILLDLPAREFTFVGTTLYPTDTLLLALLMLSVFLSIFFLTAMFGRVWCGWACPQTVYLEFVYRPIERLLEGIPGRKAKTGAWRKPLRFLVYLAISFGLANTFLAYFVGTDNLWLWVFGSPLQHFGPFLLVMFVTAMMMFDFGFFREQLCIVACPYGRFQSVLLDRNSLIISYDPNRGEPRGKKSRKKTRAGDADVSLRVVADEPRGDCIDCHMCVTTCPTGIDIRDGLQLECVNCAQCIDACDTVMDKIGKPRGLIRYGSQASVVDREPSRLLRVRTLIYPAIIALLVSAFIALLVTRQPASVSVLRGPGFPFTIGDDGMVVNPAMIKIQNRSEAEVVYALAIGNADGTVDVSDSGISVVPGQTVEAPVLLRVPRGVFDRGRFNADIVVTGNDGYTTTVVHQLIGPAKKAAP